MEHSHKLREKKEGRGEEGGGGGIVAQPPGLDAGRNKFAHTGDQFNGSLQGLVCCSLSKLFPF